MEPFASGAFWAAIGPAVLVCLAVALIPAIFATKEPNTRWALFFSILAFSLLGITVGQTTGQSRDPTIGAVIPAVLTFVSGVAAVLIAKGDQGTIRLISLLMIAFTLSFLIGVYAGAIRRTEAETALESYDYLLAREKVRFAIDVKKLEHEKTLFDLRKSLGLPEQTNIPNVDPGKQQTK